MDKDKLVKIGEAAHILGVSIDTVRRWSNSGKLKTITTPGGTRLYRVKELLKLNLATIEVGIGFAKVNYDEAKVNPSEIENAISNSGYKVQK